MITSHKNTKKTKSIPKTQEGLSHRQKGILKDFIGKSPKPPVDLNTVREWVKYG